MLRLKVIKNNTNFCINNVILEIFLIITTSGINEIKQTNP